MIAYLVAEHGLERVEAYMLCSVAGDLKMHEVVSDDCEPAESAIGC
jgi:acetamidase/formamidase